MTTTVYKKFVGERFKTFPDFPQTLLHAAVGLVGELLELKQANSRENILEELGDSRFYWVAMETALQGQGMVSEPPYASSVLSLEATIDASLDYANSLLDYAKKFWAYEKAPQQRDIDALAVFHEALGDSLNSLILLLGSTEGEVDTLNIAKLQKRYPNGYSNKDAQERKDKEEGK